MKSDESACSIVPSKMSSRLSMSTGQTGRRDSISSYASLVYRRLSFEDDLFTARVYKRNYRSPQSQRLWKQKPDSDHETITSREEQNQVVGADSMAPRSSKVFTIVPSSPMSVNIDAENSDTGPATVFHIDDIHSGGDNLEPLGNVGQAITSGALDMTSFIASHKCDSPHVCPTHSSLIEDIDFVEPLLQNSGPEYDGGHVLGKLMHCARGARWLPLHVSALAGNLPVVQLLLRKGLSVNAEMAYGIQAIHLAARNGSINVLAGLIEAGADVNCEDQDGYQPLHYLSESHDKPDVVRYLAEKGAEVNTPLNSRPFYSYTQTPLYLACRNDFIGNLKVLMSLGALTGESSSFQEERALDAAIMHRSPLSLEALLEYGVDPNTPRLDGSIGLHTFVLTFYNPRFPRYPTAEKRILQLLLEHTDLLAKDQSGHALLSRLFSVQQISKEKVLELARLFLESLPEHKSFEDSLLRSMIQSRDIKVVGEGIPGPGDLGIKPGGLRQITPALNALLGYEMPMKSEREDEMTDAVSWEKRRYWKERGRARPGETEFWV